jgi:hypothetical protein
MNGTTVTPNQKDSGFEDSSISSDQILNVTLSRSSKFLSTSLSILN